jgi:hypothetical protein
MKTMNLARALLAGLLSAIGRTVPGLMFVAALAFTTGMFAASAPAFSSIAHTWVASNGSDSASCGGRMITPCQTFLAAYNNTDAGGEITCVDSGNFGGLTISKSVTINCESSIGSSLVTGGVSPISINGSSLNVTLRGLDLDGASTTLGTICSGPSASLLTFVGSGTLHLQKMKIRRLTGPSCGVQFTPNDTATLDITDCDITDNGGSGLGAGIYVQPASGVTAHVSIDHSRINNNYFGVLFDGTQGGIIRGAIHDSVVSGNIQDGIMVSATNSSLAVDNTIVSGNGAGVLIKPYANGSMTATFDRVTISNNMGGGLKTDTTNGSVNVDISNSTIGNNGGNGLNAVGGAGGPNVLNLSHDVIASNRTAGLQANGVSAAAFVDTTLFDTNTLGATASVAGGRLLTYGNNRVVGPIGSGFPSSVPLQ